MSTATRQYQICFYLNGALFKSIDLRPGTSGSLKGQARQIAKLDHGPLPLSWVCYGADERDQIDFGNYMPPKRKD